MTWVLTIVALILSSAASFVFATLAYSLRDYSRATLGAWFEGRKSATPPAVRLARVVDHEDELALTAAVARAAANLVVVLAILHALTLLFPEASRTWIYALTFVASFVVVGVASVAIPLAVSSHAAEPAIGLFAPLLKWKRLVLWPVVLLHAPIDRLVRSAAGRRASTPELAGDEIEKEILDIVEEGSSEGVIDAAEKQMIERALRFQDVTAGQVMTPRGDIVGLPHDADAETVLKIIEETGYSRIPVYRGTIDALEGVLYARDLFRFVGKRLNGHDRDDGDFETRRFDLLAILRKPLVVPETKPLADLLRDMQAQKIHMAIVLDEYNGTSGLVTIEDIVEELVGEIADEHEDDEPPLVDRIGEHAAEADARVTIEEVNRTFGLGLPEEEGIETLGGFLTMRLGRIPPAGTTLEFEEGPTRATFTVLDAEPQRVIRVRIDLPTGHDIGDVNSRESSAPTPESPSAVA